MTQPVKKKEDDRLVIRLPDNFRVDAVNKIIKRIAALEVFQRAQILVHIVRDAEVGEGGVAMPTGEARVRRVLEATLTELSQTVCKFMMRRRRDGVEQFVEVDPPVQLIKTMTARGEWPHIRPLDGLIGWPVMRADGTVFDGLGYDARSRCYASSQVALDLPERVTRKDVQESIALFDDILRDFPFERPEHKSAWLAALLTVIARPAIDGPIPMLVVDANERGAGKTLLCDSIGEILSGKELPRHSGPNGDDEWGKVMLSIGIGSYPIILFDNVTGLLQSKDLTMVLTGNKFTKRLLGTNTDCEVMIRTQFLVSGNNATLTPDLIRRSLHCRLLVDAERPEQRSGFKYRLPDDIVEPVMRKRLLAAAVKILLGYEHAGRPHVETLPMGSYPEWSRRVQKPIVWAGMADPVVTQDEFREQADPEREQLEILLDSWYEFFGTQSLTVGDALIRVREGSSGENPNRKAVQCQAAFETLSEIPGTPITAARLGYKIRSWRDRWIKGKSFYWGAKAGGARKWGVQVKPAA